MSTEAIVAICIFSCLAIIILAVVIEEILDERNKTRLEITRIQAGLDENNGR